MVQRIEKLIEDIKLHPDSGTGKPEPMRLLNQDAGHLKLIMSMV